MAMFPTHLGTACVLGAGYGALGVFACGHGHDWGITFLAAGLTTLGGILPDIDSDSGKPVREISILAALLFPVMLTFRMRRRLGLSMEQTLVIFFALHFLIRFGLAWWVRRASVHRGMFHSIPALLLSGLAVFLTNHNDDLHIRWYLAGAMMVGYFSHLLLDELYAVDLNGLAFKGNQFAGTALKFRSKSNKATLLTYVLLALTGWLTWNVLRKDPGDLEPQMVSPRKGRDIFPGRPAAGEQPYPTQIIRPGVYDGNR